MKKIKIRRSTVASGIRVMAGAVLDVVALVQDAKKEISTADAATLVRMQKARVCEEPEVSEEVKSPEKKTKTKAKAKK